jgi:hypothetical protein
MDDEQKIGIIMRQTNYDRATAAEKLKSFDGRELDVIRDYLYVPKPASHQCASLQQRMFSEFREFLQTDEIPKKGKK